MDLINGGHFHLSYWYDEKDDTPITEAGQRITRRVVDSLGLRSGDHLLDVGCGPGGPAVLAAELTGARVTGVSISSYDVSAATRRAEESGLGDRLEFHHGDYMALTFPDASFDAVMAIESLLSAPDLDHVLGEFFRLLRPGGAVALCHCTKEAEMSEELMEQFKASNMANQLPTLPEWIEALRRAGFVVEEYSQFGHRVFGQSARYFAAVDDHHDELVAKVGAQTIAGIKQGMRGFFDPGPELVGYAIVAGRKPAA
ncbi:class I SAM-dependent methyltransferase [Actinomadura sp. DC4]|uniref:SAM-dependent methyltransferase n=1 Tax=Actinomadura sp. DC4 TaxID=3055069 RepID=UPI0025AF11E6|nr:class I SAM-dependent methyltransferase [Actinomadura sp. DC4]MDN3354697.1 class I SAM-dependent methyltransferase [Actinomadura sp. DC4]